MGIEWVYFTLAFGGIVVLPGMVLSFILLLKRMKHGRETLQIRKEMQEIELKKETLRLQSLEQENAKLDKLIAHGMIEQGEVK